MKYLAIGLFAFQIILTFIIIKTIEKHSVHPIYGNYKKHDSKGRTCEPWDSCK